MDKNIIHLFIAKEASPLFLYLLDTLNSEKDIALCDLEKYHKKGLVVIAIVAGEIAEQVEVSRQTINNWLRKLETIKFIKNVGTETVKIGNSFQDVIIWAVGEKHKGKIDFYYETATLTTSTPITKNEFVYVMQRADGIYKIGRTDNIQKRKAQLVKTYKQDFQLIRSFVVNNCSKLENLALQMTIRYQHKEEGRNELRKMTVAQLERFFLDFEKEILLK